MISHRSAASKNDTGALSVVVGLLKKHACDEFTVLFKKPDSPARRELARGGEVARLTLPRLVDYRPGGRKFQLLVGGEEVEVFLYRSTNSSSNKPNPM